VIAAMACSMDAPSLTDTWMDATSSLPFTRRWTVRSGSTIMSSGSGPNEPPFAFSRPITSHPNRFTRISLPTGFRVPNSSFRTVWPMTQTAAPARDSASVK